MVKYVLTHNRLVFKSWFWPVFTLLVTVKANKDKTKAYIISDLHQFGFIQNDKTQRGRHGFPLGNLSQWEIATLRHLMPNDEYINPGGFKERWEIKRVGKETVLFIPQQYLAQQGRPFKITGSFTRQLEEKKSRLSQ